MLTFQDHGTGIKFPTIDETSDFAYTLNQMLNAKLNWFPKCIAGIYTDSNTNIAISNTPTFTESCFSMFNLMIHLEHTENKRGETIDAPTIVATTTEINARPNENGFMHNNNPLTYNYNWNYLQTRNVHQLVIVLIKRGLNYFPALDTWINEQGAANNVTPVSDDQLNMLKFGIDIKHLKAYTHDKDLIVYTDYYNQIWANKVYSTMPHFFEDTKYLLSKECICRDIFAALYENNASKLENLIEWMPSIFEKLENKGRYDNLAKILEKNARNGISAAETEYATAEALLNNEMSRYNNAIQTFEDARKNLLRFQTEKVTVDLSLIEFLQKSKNVILKRCNENNAYYEVEITATITNYRKNDIDSWYRRKEPNTITCYPEFAALLYDALVNDEYTLITTTPFKIPINRSQENWHANRATSTKLWANPHLSRYQCWHNGQVPADKATAKNDYVTALNYAIAACGTITFTDSAVMSVMTSELLGSFKNAIIWKDKENVMHSTVELTQNKYKDCTSYDGPSIKLFVEKLHESK